MSKEIVNSHDRFFKNLFSKKEEVTEFVQKTFPIEIVKKLHLDTLQLDTTNYVDEKLKEYFADIVYNCDYTFNSKETKQVKITFLFEHKSTKPYFPHVQIGKYIFNILDTQIEQVQDRKELNKDFRLKPVIPIVFYHGKAKWNDKPFEEYFEGIDEFLLKYLPRFDYHLVDMSDYDNERIKQLFEQKQLQVGLLLMKNIFDDNNLLDLLTNIFSNTLNLSNKEREKQFYETITTYIYYSSKINFQKYIDIMETLTTEHSDTFVSTAMQLKREGKLEGEITGIEKEKRRTAFLMIQKGYSNEIIMDLTSLNSLQIKYLRTQENYDIDAELN